MPTGSRKSYANLSSSVCVAPSLAWQHDPGRQLQRSRPRTWSDGLMQYGSRQCSSISEPIDARLHSSRSPGLVWGESHGTVEKKESMFKEKAGPKTQVLHYSTHLLTKTQVTSTAHRTVANITEHARMFSPRLPFPVGYHSLRV